MEKLIVLASSSPRRQELLQNLGLPFKTIMHRVDETVSVGIKPSEKVELLALRKARAVAENYLAGNPGPVLVIGADTIVVYGLDVLGKPRDEKDACEMLELLQGKTHEVLTGVAIIDLPSKREVVFHERTKVKFRQMSMQEIRAYVKTGEPVDKAGAYGVQGLGSIFIEKIEGCYFNVVGLPVCKLVENLKGFGINIF